MITDTLVTHAPASAASTGHLFGVRPFDLSAERVGDGAPVTSFSLAYTVTVTYTDAEKGAAIESTLGLYRVRASATGYISHTSPDIRVVSVYSWPTCWA